MTSRRSFLSFVSALTLGAERTQAAGPSSEGGQPRSGIAQPSTGQHFVPAVIKAPTTGTVPFAFGQVFIRGTVPAGTGLTGSTVQVTPLTTWDDGSLRSAVVAGEQSVAAGVASAVTLRTGSTAGVALATSDLIATGITAMVMAGAYGAAAFQKADWSAPERTWIAGPLMSSWMYRKPIGSDPHLVAWLEVRLWKSGAVEVLPWIENGYLKVAGPTNKDAVFTFKLGATERFSQAIDLPNHCRTPLLNGALLAHWLGNDPSVVVRHDAAYLQATEMVPSYYATVEPAARVVATLPVTYTPLQQGGYPIGMGSAGYHSSIGLLPMWDVLYLTCPDSDLPWAALQRNAYSAGRYGIHHRDEKTNRPIRISSYPTLCLGDGMGIGGKGLSANRDTTPNATGTVPPKYTISHHPSMGYMAALITGRCYHLETLQFEATANYLIQYSATRKSALGIFESFAVSNQTRGSAWCWRTLAQVACLTPDADPLANEFRTNLANNVHQYHARYVAQVNNPQGFVRPYSSSSTEMFVNRTWMEDFFTAAVGHMKAMRPIVSPQIAVKLEEFFHWKARSIVGRFGGAASDEFLYRDAGPYDIPLAPSASANFMAGTGPWYKNWGEVWQALQTTRHATGQKEIGDGTARNGHPLSPTDHWGNLMPALSYATRHGAEGAAKAMQRMQGMSEWPTRLAAFNHAPVWGIRPAERA